MLLFAGPRKNGKASPARRARERWRIKEGGRVGGVRGWASAAAKAGRVVAPSRGLGEAYLGRTRPAGRAAAARGRGAATPGGGGGRKARSRSAPAPAQPWRGAPTPWPRVGSPAHRPRGVGALGPGTRAAVAAGTGRRAPARSEAGEAGAGRIRGQGPLARRPRRSAPSRASQPLPGNARPRSGRRAPPPGRPGACLRAARRRARRVPGPALPQDPPLRRARGTAPPRTNTAPGRLWKNSRKPGDAGDHSSRAAQAQRAAGVCAGRPRSRAAERTKPKEVGLSSPEPAYEKG